MTPVRVVVVDDQALVRMGLRALLETEPDTELVAEAEDGRAGLAAIRRTVPDVVLMDVRMPVLDGLAALREITADPRLAKVKVIVLTTFELDEYVFDALRHGASGFLLKDTKPGELLNAIRLVAEVAQAAEDANHHPDIDIRWRTVRFALSTHSAGGVTSKDTALAGRIDELALAHEAH